MAEHTPGPQLSYEEVEKLMNYEEEITRLQRFNAELEAALKQLLTTTEGVTTHSSGHDIELAHAQAVAREALAKVKGGA